MITEYDPTVVKEDFDYGSYHKITIRHLCQVETPNGNELPATAILAQINFQKGPVKEVGVNGCTTEDIIQILIDRLEEFQKTEFNCSYNKDAITYLEIAKQQLESRTQDRIARGVEGYQLV